jgi:filamentous hemagglutinin
VVQSPVSFVEGQYARPVDVGRTIGTSSLNDGGGVTTVIKIFTDGSGNLIIAFPQ